MALLDWLGQDEALAALQLSLRNRRVHHCHVFHGPDGVGKEGVARDFGATLLCETPVVVGNRARGLPLLPVDAELKQACGRCGDCRRIAAETHPDFAVVRREAGKSTVSVEIINEQLLARAHVTSSSGRGRVFILPEAERVAEAGWNKLLKTLEEPPPGMVCFIIARSAESVLPTVRSRSRAVAFRPLPAEVAERLLTDRHGVPAEEARFLARFAGGSPGEAVRRHRSGLFAVKRELVERVAGLDEAGAFEFADLLMQHARAAAKAEEDAGVADTAPPDDGDAGDGPPARGGKGRSGRADRDAGGGDDDDGAGAEPDGEAAPGGRGKPGKAADSKVGDAVRTQLRGLLGVVATAYRDVLVLGAGGGRDDLIIHVDQREVLRRAAGRIGTDAAARAAGLLADADAHIAQNGLANLVLENLAAELAQRG